MMKLAWKKIEEEFFQYDQGEIDDLDGRTEEFLVTINFFSEEDGITDIGKEYIESKFIFDRSNHYAILRHEVLNLKPIRELCQSFYGQLTRRENIERFFKSKTDVSENREVGRILSLLNEVDIVSYSKQKGTVQFKETDEVEEEDQESYRTTRRTPYSNLMRFRKVLRSCSGNLFWIDRYWNKKGLEPLAEEITGDEFNSVRILSGPEHIEPHVKSDFERFVKEMKYRGVEAKLRVITDGHKLRDLHDRWILSSDGSSWNIPPITSIYGNQEAEILKTEEDVDFENWWEHSPDIIEDWNEIQGSI